jgi:hypothetical protein
MARTYLDLLLQLQTAEGGWYNSHHVVWSIRGVTVAIAVGTGAVMVTVRTAEGGWYNSHHVVWSISGVTVATAVGTGAVMVTAVISKGQVWRSGEAEKSHEGSDVNSAALFTNRPAQHCTMKLYGGVDAQIRVFLNRL